MKTLREYRAEICIGIIGVIAVLSVFIWNAFYPFSRDDAEYAEHFGAFIGGCIGSLFSLGAMVLIFATLKNQRQTSEEQSFETKYFELLKMHRANVAEMKLWTGETGRRLFVLLVDEVRSALVVIREIASRSGSPPTLDQCVRAAYYVVFFGVGENSDRMLTNALIRLGISNESSHEIVTAIKMKQTRELSQYVPFDGHQSRLGHYYRHLYQMVRYVDQQQLYGFDQNKKYEYMKTIRAQLSTHEQALLLLNSLTPMGHNWWDKNLLIPYRLVKNIPRDFFDKNREIDLSTLFPKHYFEWEEIGASGKTHATNPAA